MTYDFYAHVAQAPLPERLSPEDHERGRDENGNGPVQAAIRLFRASGTHLLEERIVARPPLAFRGMSDMRAAYGSQAGVCPLPSSEEAPLNLTLWPPADSDALEHLADTLPPCSWLLHVKFRLHSPLITSDQRLSRILAKNAFLKEPLTERPEIRATSWKGATRYAAEMLGAQSGTVGKLWGSATEHGDDADSQKGRLIFFPTFADDAPDMAVLTPLYEERRTPWSGRAPVHIEALSAGTDLSVTIGYIPYDLLAQQSNGSPGCSADQLCDAAIADLALTCRALFAVLFVYGIGAKTSSGYGLADHSPSDTGEPRPVWNDIDVHLAPGTLRQRAGLPAPGEEVGVRRARRLKEDRSRWVLGLLSEQGGNHE